MKKICGARIRGTKKVCQKPPMQGKKRCHLHGGLSTGPRTEKGKNAQKKSVTKHGLYAKKNNPGKVTRVEIEEMRKLLEDPQELYKEIVIRLLIKLNETDNPREISSLSNQIRRYMHDIQAGTTKKSKSKEEIKKIVKERLIKLGIKIVSGGVL